MSEIDELELLRAQLLASMSAGASALQHQDRLHSQHPVPLTVSSDTMDVSQDTAPSQKGLETNAHSHATLRTHEGDTARDQDMEDGEIEDAMMQEAPRTAETETAASQLTAESLPASSAPQLSSPLYGTPYNPETMSSYRSRSRSPPPRGVSDARMSRSSSSSMSRPNHHYSSTSTNYGSRRKRTRSPSPRHRSSGPASYVADTEPDEAAVQMLKSREQAMAQDILRQLSRSPHAQPPAHVSTASYNQYSRPDFASAAASAGISPEQLYYLNAAANQTQASYMWPYSGYPPAASFVNVGTLPSPAVPPADIIEEVDMDVDSDDEKTNTALAPTHSVVESQPHVVSEAQAPAEALPSFVVTEPPTSVSTPASSVTQPSNPVKPKPANAPTQPSRPVPRPPVVARPPARMQPILPKSDPKFIIDLGADDSDSEDGGAVAKAPVDGNIDSAKAPKAPGIESSASTASKLKEMESLRQMIAQKEKQLEEKRRLAKTLAVPPTKNPKPDVSTTNPVTNAGIKSLASSLAPPEPKRQKVSESSESMDLVAATETTPNFGAIKSQVTSVFQKEEELRQQLKHLETSQLELISLHRSILVCKSERSHLETRVRILEEHLQQARKLLAKAVAKEQTLQTKVAAAEKRVGERKRTVEAAEKSMSIQRTQLKVLELDLDVRAAELEPPPQKNAVPDSASSALVKAVVSARLLVKTAMDRIDSSQSKARSDSRPTLMKRGKAVGLSKPSALPPVTRSSGSSSADPEKLASLRQSAQSLLVGMKLSTHESTLTTVFATPLSRPAIEAEPDDGVQEDPLLLSAKISSHVMNAGNGGSDSTTSAITQRHMLPSEYVSPIMCIRALRLSEDFPISEHLITSRTWTNRVDPAVPFCPYEQSGSCNDPSCKYQHSRDAYFASEDDILNDLISYADLLPDGSRENLKAMVAGSAPIEQKAKAIVAEIRRQIERQMPVSKFVVTACRKKVSSSHAAPNKTQRLKRKKVVGVFTPQKSKQQVTLDHNVPSYAYPADEVNLLALEPGPTTDAEEADHRYFESGGPKNRSFSPCASSVSTAGEFEQMISLDPNLSPLLWLDYARLCSEESDSVDMLRTSSPEHIDVVLEILSRGLECHRESAALWFAYLSIFPLRAESVDEVDQYTNLALQYTKSSNCALLALAARLTRQLDKRRVLLALSVRQSLLPSIPTSVILSSVFGYCLFEFEASRLQDCIPMLDLCLEHLSSRADSNPQSDLASVALCVMKSYITAEKLLLPRSTFFAIPQPDPDVLQLSWSKNSTDQLNDDPAVQCMKSLADALQERSSGAADVCIALLAGCVSVRHDRSSAIELCQRFVDQKGHLGCEFTLMRLAEFGQTVGTLLGIASRLGNFIPPRLRFSLIITACGHGCLSSDPNAVMKILVEAAATFGPPTLDWSACYESSPQSHRAFTRLRALYAKLLGLPPSIYFPQFVGDTSGPAFGSDPWMWLLFCFLETIRGEVRTASEIFRSAIDHFKAHPMEQMIIWVQYASFYRHVADASIMETMSLLSRLLADWSPASEQFSSDVVSVLLSPATLTSQDTKKISHFLGVREWERFDSIDAWIEVIEPRLPPQTRRDFVLQVLKIVPQHTRLCARYITDCWQQGDISAARYAAHLSLKFRPYDERLWIVLVALELSLLDESSVVEARALVEEALQYVPHSSALRKHSLELENASMANNSK